MKTKKKKGGDYEEEGHSQDFLQDIRDSTSIHARDGDVPVNQKRFRHQMSEPLSELFIVNLSWRNDLCRPCIFDSQRV